MKFVLTLGAGKQKNAPKLYSNYLKDIMQNQTISELYTYDNKSKYSSNPKKILNLQKKFWKTLHQENFHSC